MNFQRLNRCTYGPTPDSLKELDKIGWEKWVNQQLHPSSSDHDFDKAMKETYIEMEWDNRTKNVRFEYYYAKPKELWELAQYDNPDPFKIARPFYESIAYSWMKQIYSKWQLNEIMVEFWHNHFNISGESGQAISLLFAEWDRGVIRKHTLGNFRTFLEATAKSPVMLYYLDGVYNKKNPANENYAREIMELHTMGEDAYFNHLYKKRSEVPGFSKGLSEGYIDLDVYEVARCFTGWTVGNHSSINEDPKAKQSGEFQYRSDWHDNGEKIVLGKKIPANQSAMKDGKDVLDLLAYHPATAKFMAKKLCTWLIADNPPKSIIDKAAKVWKENQKAPDQIRRVVKTILMSQEFDKNLGSKFKRPNILMSSYIRSVGMQFTPFSDYHWYLMEMGYKQYYWGPPTGHPDETNYWVNTDMMLKRWNTIGDLIYADDSYASHVAIVYRNQTPAVSTLDELIDYWSVRLLGKKLDDAKKAPLKKVMWKDVDYKTNIAEIRKQYPKWYEDKIRVLTGLIGCTPEFQQR